MTSLWILEDDDGLRELLCMTAEGIGSAVFVYGSLAEAWEATRAAEAGGPAPSHILSDFHLHGETSLAWLLHVRRLWPSSHVACSSALLPDHVEARLLTEGIEIFHKPVSPVHLLMTWFSPEHA